MEDYFVDGRRTWEKEGGKKLRKGNECLRGERGGSLSETVRALLSREKTDPSFHG